MANRLTGKRVAFLATDGVEQVELTRPWDALKAEGAQVELVSLTSGRIQGMNSIDKGDTFTVDRTVDQASAEEFDALVLPGGVKNPDLLRMNDAAVKLAGAFFQDDKPVAAICHAPWTLVEAGVVDGRTLTSYPSLQTDIRNAGGTWVDEEVFVDRGLVTSRRPADLDAFIERTIEEIAEGTHGEQRG